jgi:hypothetical protein
MVVFVLHGSKILVHDLCGIDFGLLKNMLVFMMQKNYMSMEYWIYKI